MIIDRVIAIQMGQVGSDEGHIAQLKVGYTVADKALSGAFKNQHKFVLRMKVPGCGIERIVKFLDDKRLLGL